MPVPSPDIFSRVLGAGAVSLALWASCRIGLWLVANVARDVRERIEGEQAQSGGSGTGKPRPDRQGASCEETGRGNAKRNYPPHA